MPIQPGGAKNFEGTVNLLPEFAGGIKDLDGFSHIILIYHFHKVKGYNLLVTPFMDDTKRGVFATRSPKRPAAIGLSIVEIRKIETNKIYFNGADMLNGTPLLDIKPYFRQIDNFPDSISGWLENKNENLFKLKRSDTRFKD